VIDLAVRLAACGGPQLERRVEDRVNEFGAGDVDGTASHVAAAVEISAVSPSVRPAPPPSGGD